MLQKVKYVGSGNLDGINNSSQCFESQTFEFPKFKIAEISTNFQIIRKMFEISNNLTVNM